MKTEVISLNQGNFEESIERAGEIIKKGGLVAFPTETVYGLGADGMREEAAAKIYAAKNRPSDNPLILHIWKKEQLTEFVTEVPEAAKKLMDAYWPGPLTMIFKKKSQVPFGTTGGLDTVAVRMPDHPVAAALIRAAGTPIAAPSANTSGRPSPTRASHVVEDMDGKVEMILDGGECGIGLESTIVDVTGEIPVLLRPGYISKEMLEELLGTVAVDKAVTRILKEGERPKAPGMKYRHYAPKAELTVYDGETETVVSYINKLAKNAIKEGKKVLIVAAKENKCRYEAGEVLVIGAAADDGEIARNLFDILRECDARDADVIYSEMFHGGQLEGAITNRLMKAAGYHIEKIEGLNHTCHLP